jgi:hypothetical protein
VLACLAAAPASASTLRLTSVADTSFSPGVQDDTAASGDTFILELWVNATDTDVNGAEATLQFDGTQLELLESAEAGDSFPQGSAGLNSDEDHSVFGDVLANNGLALGTATDTARYAALTVSDSTRTNSRLARFLFQVRTTATQGLTYITFRSTANETTAVTASETNGRNVLTATDTGTIRITAGSDTHAVFTLVAPRSPEYFTIFNPTSAAIDLSKYYVSDDDSGYITASTVAPTAAAGDFIAHFPGGATLAAGETVTVALSSDSFHATFPGVKVDYELNPDGTADGVTGLIVDDTTGVVELLDAGEALILFQWDGISDRVKDVDILVWGSGTIPNKTGKSIDGIDGDASATAYLGDSASMTAAAAPGAGQVLRRASFLLGDTAMNERKLGGNGIYGHDETSESTSISWAVSTETAPWHRMVLAWKRGDYAASTAYLGDTDIEALSVTIRGSRGVAENLTQLDVVSLGLADTGNIDTVSLWIDVNSDSVIDATDTRFDLAVTGTKSWRFSGSISLPAFAGRNFILGFRTGSTIQTGETVQFSIASYAIQSSISDSGSFVALTSNAAITLSRIVFRVDTVVNTAAATLRAGDTGVTALAIRIRGNGADTLTNFAIANGGRLDDTDVDLFLWRDADGSATYTVGDVLVGQLVYSVGNARWETSNVGVPIAAAGDTFILTLSVAATAGIEGDSFLAIVSASSAGGVVADTGPATSVTNPFAQTLANPMATANHLVIAAVYPDDANSPSDGDGEWVLIYNPTDTPTTLQNWTLRRSGTTEVAYPNVTLAARSFFLAADTVYPGAKDVATWPSADLLDTMQLNNTNDGITLHDSTGAIVDRVGWGTEATDKEGTTLANPSAASIFVRKAHALTTLVDLYLGGRDEFGGAAYDMFDNATDFVTIAGADSASWTLRSNVSAAETPAQKTTVVKIFTNIGSSVHTQSETGVTAAAVYIQGDTTAAGTLSTFRVSATDPIEDTNFTSIRLYEDANANSSYDAADTLVATLPSLGGATWETSGMSYGFDSLNGETFLVVLNIADTVTNGETFQARIAVRTVKASGADSGPTVARTNSGVITVTTLNPLVITKHADIANDTVAPTADSLTVIAFRLRGNPAGDTLTRFTITNAGAMDTSDIVQVQLFADANGDSRYTAGDTFVATLTATAPRTWTASGLSTRLGTGLDFVVTIDLGTATNLDSFLAVIPQNGCNVVLFDTGPSSTISENGRITASNAAAIRILITEVAPGAATPFVELWVLDDGNGGAGVDITGWRLTEYATGATTDRKVLGDSDNNGVAESTVFVRTGERIVFYDGNVLDEANANGDSIIAAGNAGQVFTSTDDELVLYDPTNSPRDAVIWTNRDGAMAADDDFRGVISIGMWKGGIFDTTQNNAVTPRQGTSVGAGNSYQRGGVTDRDTYLDWGEANATPGAANTVESPAIAPARLSGISLADLPDDLGGTLRVTWTPDTSNVDFLQYRVYLETYPLVNLIETNVLPRTTITDSSTGSTTILGLTNGDSYYAVVTAVDSVGLEYRFGLTQGGPTAPQNNITGTPRLVLNEVFAQASGGADTDYIEIYVADDGNPTGRLNLAGWKIEWHSAGTKTLGSATVATGEYLVLNFNSSATDETDSGLDNITTLYNVSTGLAAGSGYARVLTPSDSIVDFLFYSTRTTSLASTLQTAVRTAVDSGAWRGETVPNAAVNGAAIDGGFGAGDVFARDGNASDTTHSRDDWSVTNARSKGAANAGVEHPITIPDSRTVRIYRDLANDLGGTLEIGWDTITSLTDFLRYNIYLDTRPIGARIDTSALLPDSTVSDSSVGYVAISGLVNGESYYLVVTVTDSWGHEKRIPLTDTGLVVPVRNVTGQPVIRFTEVKFSNTDTSEFIEMRVITDGNPGGGLSLSGFKVAADDTAAGDIITFGGVTVGDSDYIVLRKASGTSEIDSGLDGVVNIYNMTFSLVESEEGLFLIEAGGDTIMDFVYWSGRDGVMTAAEATDLAYAVARGAWDIPNGTENAGRNPLLFSNFDNNASITRDLNHADTDSDVDWAVDSPPTPGAAPNIAEAPFAPPAAVAGTAADDVAGDLGNVVRVVWTPAGVADLHHYNIYRETSSIASSLYTTNLFPRDTAGAADSSILVSNLTNGETYWFAVTAVDSYGSEVKVGLLSDTAVPVANVSGETLLITEVSFTENSTGVNGQDWVEIYVVYDGNSGNGITLNNWNVVTTAAGNPSKNLTGVTARTGDRIVIYSTTGTDETDSGGDGVISLYWGATGLIGTDNSVTIYRPTSDTEDFVAWTSLAGAPVNAADSRAIAAAIAAGQWTDVAPAGVGTEDGVFSDTVTNNWSIKRSPDTADVNGLADWVVDTDPTPGAANDSKTLWRITGTLDLESRALDGGCTVLAFAGGDTYVTRSDNSGSYVLRVTAGAWTLRGETIHYLRRAATGITVTTSSLLNQNIGLLYAGDADGDNMISIFDGSITKYALDRGTGNPAADHVDPAGVTATDLQAVRDNFGRKGD